MNQTSFPLKVQFCTNPINRLAAMFVGRRVNEKFYQMFAPRCGCCMFGGNRSGWCRELKVDYDSDERHIFYHDFYIKTHGLEYGDCTFQEEVDILLVKLDNLNCIDRLRILVGTFEGEKSVDSFHYHYISYGKFSPCLNQSTTESIDKYEELLSACTEKVEVYDAPSFVIPDSELNLDIDILHNDCSGEKVSLNIKSLVGRMQASLRGDADKRVYSGGWGYIYEDPVALITDSDMERIRLEFKFAKFRSEEEVLSAIKDAKLDVKVDEIQVTIMDRRSYNIDGDMKDVIDIDICARFKGGDYCNYRRECWFVLNTKHIHKV